MRPLVNGLNNIKAQGNIEKSHAERTESRCLNMLKVEKNQSRGTSFDALFLGKRKAITFPLSLHLRVCHGMIAVKAVLSIY